ncbi:MAG: PadR family transcriptional regulator [Bryobacterales bacterium]
MAKPTDFVQGTLDLLILKTISFESKHGWAIAKHIQLVSQEALQIQQGRCTRRCTVWSSKPGSRPSGARPRPGEWQSSIPYTFGPAAFGTEATGRELANWVRLSTAINIVVQEA